MGGGDRANGALRAIGRPPARLGLLALAATLAAAFALALPAGASAAKYSLTIHKTGTGKGTVECEVAGGARGTCASSYVEETELIIYATPSAGFVFSGWTDEYCEFYETEPCELTLEEPAIVAAEFGPIPKYRLEAKTMGSGTGKVECEVAGSGTAGPCGEYPAETELNLYAVPGSESEFVEWTDDDCFVYGAEPCEVTFEEEPVAVVAEFGPIPKYPLVTETTGTGKGAVECEVAGSGTAGPCASGYPAETELNLYAVAGPESEFVEWTGACLGSSCNLTVEEEATDVTAVFKSRPQVPFSVVKSGSGTGTVSCGGGACASSYSEGTKLTLVASPAPGSTFAGWSGGGCSGTGSCQVTVKSGMTVTATFDAVQAPPASTPLAGIPTVVPVAFVRSGYAVLRLTCDEAPCRGELKLTAKIRAGKTVKRVAIGARPFAIPAGASRALTVTLSHAARRQLARGGRLKAKLTGTGIAEAAVLLKLRR